MGIIAETVTTWDQLSVAEIHFAHKSYTRDEYDHMGALRRTHFSQSLCRSGYPPYSGSASPF